MLWQHLNDTLLIVLAATLYLIATPIGNLEDITLRALRILREEAALIACEDTRQTRKLLDHFEIRKPLVSYHEHNEASRAQELIEALERGEPVALVSDAGTPLVSDPGYRVVHAAIERGLPVVPVPGPSAVLAALAASGLPTDQFRFLGFVPAKMAARRSMFQELALEQATVVCYESPHRILECLMDMAEILADRPVVLARELTKIHEEFLRGTAGAIRTQLEERGAVRGEITLVIGRSTEKPAVADPLAEIARLQEEGLDRMEAIKAVAKRMGLPKREVYRLAAEQDSNPPGKRRR
ncbi:MAG TPA: 16S rRNA (cytidine(1402)-2'-O)-methyltransferase [Bryobacteraceae bacterium]|jgi:16S rRNA (cytidine1402-2'-O)-methyltransferase|nr:16S rRNA (cytidine(1402)-2'-O)-methyltransferase [Bryobacteraceae bacterium]